MARIRTIKPEFFRHEDLFAAEKESGLPLRLVFAGLWTACDREGRFRWRPRALKLDILPYDDIDFFRVLEELAARGFVLRYATPLGECGCIPSWSRHQVINNREAESDLPPPDASATRDARVNHASRTPLVHAQGEGKRKGTEGCPSSLRSDDASKPNASRETQRGTALPFAFPGNRERSEARCFFRDKGRADLAEQLDDHAAQFRDYHTAKGTRSRDWAASWRTWTRNALAFHRRPPHGAAAHQGVRKPSAHENFLKGAAIFAGFEPDGDDERNDDARHPRLAAEDSRSDRTGAGESGAGADAGATGRATGPPGAALLAPGFHAGACEADAGGFLRRSDRRDGGSAD
jgi:hypothetical protein